MHSPLAVVVALCHDRARKPECCLENSSMFHDTMPALLRQYRGAVVALAFLLAGSAQAQPKTKTNMPPPDHGMVLATCIDVAPGQLKDTTRRVDTKNYVFRGRVIALDKERTVHL